MAAITKFEDLQIRKEARMLNREVFEISDNAIFKKTLGLGLRSKLPADL